MGALTPLTAVVGRPLDRVLRRNHYRWIWDWQARSLHNADLAVAGFTDPQELQRSGASTAARIAELTRMGGADVVLEIGCGTGRVGVHTVSRCQEWIGADVSRAMLRHAQRRLAGHANARFVALDGVSLASISPTTIDVVYCTAVFMHLDEWDRFAYIEEAWRVLRPGGRLYVDNLNLTGELGWGVFQQLRATPPRLRPPQASRCSTPQELEAYLTRAGFRNVVVRSEPLFVSATGDKPGAVAPAA